MTAEAPSESVTRRRYVLLYLVPAILVVICGALYVFLGGVLPPHPRRIVRVHRGPDATTLISTLVVIYTFFAAAYGALAPSLVGKDRRSPTFLPTGKEDRAFWRGVALVYILLAVILDLARVWNSLGDLYATTMRELPPVKIYDAVTEFTRYLILNAVVLLLVLVIAFWPERRKESWLLRLIRKFGIQSKHRTQNPRERPKET
jgi:hypothetical protein